MPFTLVRNDIVNMQVDAIVNSAGTRTSRIGGVEGSILNVGGPELRKEQLALGTMKLSEARYTSAPNLPSKYVIHVIGPIYDDANDMDQKLREAYQNCFEVAKQLNVSSIAFPLISSGSYGFPKKKALVIAQEEIIRFLEHNEMMIYLVVFDKSSFTISQDFQKEIRQYVRTDFVEERFRQLRKMDASRAEHISEKSIQKGKRKSSLQEYIENVEDGFTTTLLRLIDETGQKDSDIYKKANIDRKLFSKIRNNPFYRPSKNTIIAFAVALELSLNDTNDLLSRAGYILSKSIKFDIIIRYCIRKEIYNIYQINEMLFVEDQELLGSH